MTQGVEQNKGSSIDNRRQVKNKQNNLMTTMDIILFL